MENIRELIDGLRTAHAKSEGTIADRIETRAKLVQVLAAMEKDPQGFLMHLDAIEHAWRSGAAYGAQGGDMSLRGRAQGFADYETKRRAELGL